MSNVHDFDYIQINLASPDRIKQWGTRQLPNGQLIGEVTKTDTINYRTFKPEMDGLFCEKIFGPVKNWECYCGKNKRVKPKDLFICERCGVEVTESRVRRHRMGYIQLVSPVTHVWYLKGMPSYISLILRHRLRTIEEIVYFNRHFIIDDSNSPNRENNSINSVSFQDDSYFLTDVNTNNFSQERSLKIGAESIKYLLDNLDLNKELIKNRLAVSLFDNGFKLFDEETKEQLLNNKEKLVNNKETRGKILRRIRLIENFIATGSNPSWMVLDVIPVIPPGLRPMVQLEGGRFATSDLNELYRRVITRNNRLGRLSKMFAPAIVVHNEKRLLQEAVDTLIDNGKRGRKVLGAHNRALKSLSDIIEGKHGRFRQNLLGKRVDYSARSVIIVGPSLKLNQCGLPHEIALQLFQPFIIHQLMKNGLASNMKLAKKLIQTGDSFIWKILENILKEHPVLLNRAPTLHRLGIQAFEPILVPGRAVHLHPLVCTAFNADFDGDQMAIHLPLSLNAKNEAKNRMLATNNFLSPANGDPIIMPTQDMVLGCYYLTLDNSNAKKNANHYFADFDDAVLAYRKNKILMHTPIWVRNCKFNFLPGGLSKAISKSSEFQIVDFTSLNYIRTTVGRIIINLTISKNLQL